MEGRNVRRYKMPPGFERDEPAGSTQTWIEPSPKSQTTVWLDPSCGLRCLACLGVVGFHIAWFIGVASENRHEIDKALAGRSWFTLVFSAEPPMQTFMCLTGFLAALSLVPALERTQSYIITILRYYKKRAMRIVPAYYMVLLIVRIVVSFVDGPSGLPPHIWNGFFGTYGAFDQALCKSMMKHNLFFTQNQLPTVGCFTVTWSLSVQVHFWLSLPLMLLLMQPHMRGFRKRAAMAFIATIAAVLAYRGWQLCDQRLWDHMPLQIFAPPDAEHLDLLVFLGRHNYFGTFSRLCPLCWGALSALAALSPDFAHLLSRHRKQVHALWISLMLFNFLGCFVVNKYGPHRDPHHPLSNVAVLTFAYICIQGILSPLLPALTLVLTTTRQPGISAASAKFLSCRPLRWLSDITYDIYLTHPLVFLLIWYMLPPTTWFAPDLPGNFALVACLVVTSCIAAGWMHNRCWSKVSGALRRRYKAQ